MVVQKARDEQELPRVGIYFFFARDPRKWCDLGSFGAVQLQKKRFKQQTTNTTGLTQTNRWVRLQTGLNWLELTLFIIF